MWARAGPETSSLLQRDASTPHGSLRPATTFILVLLRRRLQTHRRGPVLTHCCLYCLKPQFSPLASMSWSTCSLVGGGVVI